MFNQQLFNILEQLHREQSRNHDCYYKEGFGALFVPQGYPLHPRNVILQISEQQLAVMRMGATLNFNFNF